MLSHADNAALQAVINDGQSTHGYAPEASTARLISVLRAAYPDIQMSVLTDAADLTSVHRDPTIHGQLERQNFLANWLTRIITCLTQKQNPSLAKHLVSPEDKAHQDNLQPILYITKQLLESQKWGLDDKARIIKKIHRLITTHPGGAIWDEYEHQWSTNRIYNAEAQRMEAVIASPAETLQLVCAAMLDTERY